MQHLDFSFRCQVSMMCFTLTCLDGVTYVPKVKNDTEKSDIICIWMFQKLGSTYSDLLLNDVFLSNAQIAIFCLSNIFHYFTCFFLVIALIFCRKHLMHQRDILCNFWWQIIMLITQPLNQKFNQTKKHFVSDYDSSTSEEKFLRNLYESGP